LHSGLPLDTASQWRHIIIIINCDLLAGGFSRILTEKQQIIINHILQTKHGAEVAHHHYPLSMKMLIGTIHEFITAFQRISHGWHWLFGLDKTSRPQVSQVMPTDEFLSADMHTSSSSRPLLTQLILTAAKIEPADDLMAGAAALTASCQPPAETTSGKTIKPQDAG
jgi:hypothetical protein